MRRLFLGKRSAGALIGAGLSAMVFIGCGGSSEDSTSKPSTATSASETSPSSNKASESEESGLEPSSEFLGSGPNGSLAKIGQESSIGQREAASRVLEEFFLAGSAGDWETQCSLLAASAKESLEASSLGSVDCATALEAQANRAPASVRAITMTGPIDAFRINQGINGFAFYHGTGGKDYVIPLIEQRGGWKVVALRSEEIPP